jgi:hypothetical protein
MRFGVTGFARMQSYARDANRSLETGEQEINGCNHLGDS